MTKFKISDARNETGLAAGGTATEASRLDAMAARLARVERTCRRWKLAGAGLATSFLLLVAMAAAREGQIIEAEHFVHRDADGAIRAAWAMRPDKTPGLGLFDAEGKPRLSLDVATDGAPGVNLYDADGSLRAALAVRPDGTPGHCLADPRGKIRVSLDLGEDGTSGANLYSTDGTLRAALAIRRDGTPALGIFDTRGAIQRSFAIGADVLPDQRRKAPHGAKPGHPGHPKLTYHDSNLIAVRQMPRTLP
jgi:hypothetical protein